MYAIIFPRMISRSTLLRRRQRSGAGQQGLGAVQLSRGLLVVVAYYVHLGHRQQAFDGSEII